MKVIKFIPGEPLESEGQEFLFVAPIDADTVLARSTVDGRNRVVKIASIQPIETETTPDRELSQISDAEWNVAKLRYSAIQPLLKAIEPESAAYLAQAVKHRVHFVTLYRWRSKFLKSGMLNSLLPTKRGPKRGKLKLDLETESLLKQVIHEYYLTAQKPSVIKVFEEIGIRCRQAGLVTPHYNTVRKRVLNVSKIEATRRREGHWLAEQMFTPNDGQVTAEYPLAIVQIDHTLLDLILVDDDSRMPIGRPWITVAFDVCTRAVLGFYLSLDPPGALSAGICLSRAILKKDGWLALLGQKAEWPCWGIPTCIHMDNAKEFRGEMLQRACEQYGIETHWRPVARPNWGGHIERYMLTFARELKTLPGATFSNPDERGEYASEKNAAMTIAELERYLIVFITETYHRKVHGSLQRTPLAAWNEGIFGSKASPGTGLPRLVVDEDRFKLDFLPFEHRTVNEYGVLIDGIHYYADVLRPYVNSRNPDRYHTRRSFLFRRDPRDVSQVYFWDDENQLYHPIPYRNTARPPISLWELRAAKRYLRERAESQDDEDAIFQALQSLRFLVTTSVKETKKRRREAQRAKVHHEVRAERKSQVKPHTDLVQSSNEDLSSFTAYDDVE